VCYDSLSQKKSRSSKDYHIHIKEVNHLSTIEHANITINISIAKLALESDDVLDIFMTLLNRPGIFVNISDPQNIKLTLNCRSIAEWGKYSNYGYIGLYLEQSLQSLLNKVTPLLSKPFNFHNKDHIGIELVEPESPNEIWCSIFFTNVSRIFSHELVRHGDFSAISQRSGRFCEEEDTPWIPHPLIDEDTIDDFNLVKLEGQDRYKKIYDKLLLKMGKTGVDKLTARKQCRSAARGVLGNALMTEMIFSASLAQWQHILKMRASEAADAEIRIVFNEVYELLRNRWLEHFMGWSTSPCKDNIGFQVVAP
jgi:thymidylate synthase ThyX